MLVGYLYKSHPYISADSILAIWEMAYNEQELPPRLLHAVGEGVLSVLVYELGCPYFTITLACLPERST